MDSHRGPNDWLAAYSLGSKEKEMLANLVELACEVTDAVQYRTNNGALKTRACIANGRRPRSGRYLSISQTPLSY